MSQEVERIRKKVEAINRRNKHIASMIEVPEDYEDEEIKESIASNFRSIMKTSNKAIEIMGLNPWESPIPQGGKFGNQSILTQETTQSGETSQIETVTEQRKNLNGDEQEVGVFTDETPESVIAESVDENEEVIVDLGQKVKECEEKIHDLEEKNMTLQEYVHLKDLDIDKLQSTLINSKTLHKDDKSLKQVKALKKRNDHLEEVVMKLENELNTKDKIIEQLEHDNEFLDHVNKDFEKEIKEGVKMKNNYFKPSNKEEREEKKKENMMKKKKDTPKVKELREKNIELNNAVSKLRRYCLLLQEENERAMEAIKFETERANELEMEVIRHQKIIREDRGKFEGFKEDSISLINQLNLERAKLISENDKLKEIIASYAQHGNFERVDITEFVNKFA